MKDALIGYTGFVGSTLLRQTAFDDLFNSGNIESLAGRTYNVVVCAGAPAQKWIANREPERDRASIRRLADALASVRASHVVLISTVDVFPRAVGVTEDASIRVPDQEAYGRHRFELERFVRANFPCTIVRLPGLFGEGLKKNIIFDFLHNNEVSKVHARSVYQFYDMSNLWRDLQTARRHRLELVHFATEPVSVSEVAFRVFGVEYTNEPSTVPAHYDLRSKHAERFGGGGGYIYTREQVLIAMRAFVDLERSKRSAPGDLESGVAA